MRILFFIYILFGFCVANLSSQNFGNSWCQPGLVYSCVPITLDSWYRISYEELVSMGLEPNAASLRIISNGESIPYQSPTTWMLNPGEYISFWGQKNKGETDLALYKNPGDRPNKEISLFSDTRMYYLVNDASITPLHYQSIFTELDNNVAAYENTILYTAYHEPHNSFYNGQPFQIGDINNWYSEMDYGEGFIGGLIINGQSKTEIVHTPDADYAQGGTALIELKIQGNNNDIFLYNDHHVDISINDVFCYSLIYEGHNDEYLSFELPISRISDSTYVTMQTVGDLTEFDYNSFIYIKVTYPRMLKFGDEEYFTIKDFSSDSTKLRIKSRNDDTSQPLIVDPLNSKVYYPAIHPYGNYYQLAQEGQGNGFRNLLVIDPNFYTNIAVDQVYQHSFVDFSIPDNQGDFIIITHPSLMGEVTEAYKNYRESLAGGEHNVVIVDIENLYHQFAYGVDKSPLAIRNFVNFALANWSSPPTNLLLAGKSIDYNSMRYNEEARNLCLVPTFGSPPCDYLLVAPSPQDSKPQISIGRIPANNSGELNNYLQKLIQHESLALNPCNEQDLLWTKKSLQCVSGYNTNESNIFLNYLQGYLPYIVDSPYSGEIVATLTQSVNGNVPQPTMPSIINNGVGLITYMGHPTTNGTVYWNFDIEPPSYYTNEGKYPLINANSCFSGNIHSYGNSVMAEEYTLAQDRGSIGYVAIVNFGFPAFMDFFNEAFYERLLTTQYGQPIGQSIKDAVVYLYTDGQNSGNSQGITKTCQSLVFAGDPAVSLVSFELPELYTYESEINLFTPPNLPGENIHQLEFSLINGGKGIVQQVPLKITHTAPDLVQSIITDTLLTISGISSNFIISFNQELAVGTHNFQLVIDDENVILESCEFNNIANYEVAIAENICPILDLQILNLPQDICPNGGNVPLQANQPGGIFTIDNDTVTVLNSASYNLGSHIVKYYYSQGSCNYVATEDFYIVALPQLNFDRPQKICVSNQATVVYNGSPLDNVELLWTFPPGVTASGTTGPGPHTLSFDSPANYQITLAVSNTACNVNPVTKNILVEPEIGDVSIACYESTSNSITLSVNAETPVYVYGVIVNGQFATNGIVNEGLYELNNLTQGLIYEIAMYGKGNSVAGSSCGTGDTSNVVTCSTLPCPNIDLQILGLEDSTICMYGGDITLSANYTGGLFSGQGVTDNMLDPIAAALGVHTIKYEYTDSISLCTFEVEQEITIVLEPVVTLDNTTMLCDNGLAILTATPGFEEYSWSNGTLDSNQISTNIPDTYNVLATDENGCSASDTITITEMNMVTSEMGFSEDTIYLTSNNGWILPDMPAYNYLWDNGETSDSVYVDQDGMISLQLWDQQGCTITDEVYVNLDECVDFSVYTLATNTSCDFADGAITIFTTGGQIPIAYTVNGIATGNEILDINGGDYFITVTDANNCTLTTNTIVEQLTSPQISLGSDSVVTENPFWILQIPSDFQSILWSTGSSDTIITVSESGMYSVSVMNDQGCVGSDSIYISFIGTPTAIDADMIPICNDQILYADNNTIMILNDELMELYLYDMNGRAIVTDQKSNSEYKINSSLPNGLYIIKLLDRSGNSCTLKWVKH